MPLSVLNLAGNGLYSDEFAEVDALLIGMPCQVHVKGESVQSVGAPGLDPRDRPTAPPPPKYYYGPKSLSKTEFAPRQHRSRHTATDVPFHYSGINHRDGTLVAVEQEHMARNWLASLLHDGSHATRDSSPAALNDVAGDSSKAWTLTVHMGTSDASNTFGGRAHGADAVAVVLEAVVHGTDSIWCLELPLTQSQLAPGTVSRFAVSNADAVKSLEINSVQVRTTEGPLLFMPPKCGGSSFSRA